MPGSNHLELPGAHMPSRAWNFSMPPSWAHQSGDIAKPAPQNDPPWTPRLPPGMGWGGAGAQSTGLRPGFMAQTYPLLPPWSRASMQALCTSTASAVQHGGTGERTV